MSKRVNGAEQKPADPAVKRCIDAYHQAFLARFGFKPQIHGGKDGAHVKALVATWGEATVMALVAEFFATTDPRVLRSDYTLGALYSLAQHLRLRGQTVPDPRTAENLDAATRAMRPRQQQATATAAARLPAREGDKR